MRLRRAAWRRAASWTASSTASNLSLRSLPVLSHSTSSSRCCCATSSRCRFPDSYDFGRLLLGILIFWGIAATSYRGSHITVDLLYANVGERLQRAIDVFATLVLLFVVTVQTYTLFDKVRGTYADHVLTFDLRLPVWPFFLVAWLGDVSAVLLIAVRTYRLIFHPDLLGGHYQIKPVE